MFRLVRYICYSDVDIASEDFPKLVTNKFKDIKSEAQTEGNVVVTFKSDITYWNENDIVSSTANDGVDMMEYLFKNPNVNSVYLETPTSMVDEKGYETDSNVVKVTWTREGSEEVNYANFKGMVG